MIITEQDKNFMREAIRIANRSVENGGGPFGAVIVKDGEIIVRLGVAQGGREVTSQTREFRVTTAKKPL